MQFSKSEIASTEDSALMITSTIILVLFSTVVSFIFLIHRCKYDELREDLINTNLVASIANKKQNVNRYLVP